MIRVKPAMIVSAIAAAAWCGAPLAQSTTPGTGGASEAQGKGKNSSLKHNEKKFLETTAQHNMAEVEAGKLAESKASNPETKKFGQQMVQDHSKSLDEVSQLAK